MQLTDKVILLKTYTEALTGNKYPAKTEPYQYGELPKAIRDNPTYVRPVSQVRVTEQRIRTYSPLANGNEERIDARPQEPVIELKATPVKTIVEEIKDTTTTEEEQASQEVAQMVAEQKKPEVEEAVAETATVESSKTSTSTIKKPYTRKAKK